MEVAFLEIQISVLTEPALAVESFSDKNNDLNLFFSYQPTLLK